VVIQEKLGEEQTKVVRSDIGASGSETEEKHEWRWEQVWQLSIPIKGPYTTA
jgi:hypothetical protein